MILKYIDYKSSNVNNQLYLDDDLICNDLRNCKMFMQFLNLELVRKYTIDDRFCGEYTVYEYRKKYMENI